MPGFTAPKLLWIAQHEPEIFARIGTVVLPKDYVRFRLTGELVTDVSDAAGTLWLDEAARTWSVEILAATGLSAAQMPRLVGLAYVWRSESRHRAQWGCGRMVVVEAQGCRGWRHWYRRRIGGRRFVSLGTSGQYFITTPLTAVSAGLRARLLPRSPDRWYQMAAMLNGASCLAWAAKLVGSDDVGALLARVEASYRGGQCDLPPYLTGERTPHNDPYARACSWAEAETSTGALIQSVLRASRCLWPKLKIVWRPWCVVERVAAIGGSRSCLWMIRQRARSAVVLYQEGLAPAYGAARLAVWQSPARRWARSAPCRE
jgi:xylulokinase